MRVKGKITVEVPALISPQHITMFTEGRIFEPRLTMLASNLPHLQSQCWHPLNVFVTTKEYYPRFYSFRTSRLMRFKDCFISLIEATQQ